MHNAARRHGVTIDVDLSYLDLPLCVGHDDDGNPIVEVKPWPFLLPHHLVRNSFSVQLWFVAMKQIILNPIHPAHLEAQALVRDGFFELLVDLGRLESYWNHMLRDYPNHPATGNTSSSIPIMLYGYCAAALSLSLQIFSHVGLDPLFQICGDKSLRFGGPLKVLIAASNNG